MGLALVMAFMVADDVQDGQQREVHVHTLMVPDDVIELAIVITVKFFQQLPTTVGKYGTDFL